MLWPWYGLAVLLGRESGDMPVGLALEQIQMVEESEFSQLSTEHLLQAAESNRPDLLGQGFSVQRSESSVGINRAKFYPQLSLNGSVDGSRLDDMGFEGDDFGSTVSANLSYNFFRGGGDQARVAEAKSSQREAARTLEQQKIRCRVK